MARANGNGGAVVPATRQPAALVVKAELERAKDRIEAVLPESVRAEKVIQVVTTLVARTPELQQCHPTSIVLAAIEGCELGLSFSKSAGEAYLVPFKGNATFIPGYRGLIKLAMRSGLAKYVRGEVVREGDEFSYGFHPRLRFDHVPLPGGEGRPVTHAYAHAVLTTDEDLVAVLTAEEVEAVRQRSRAGNSGPWRTDWCEMAKKTAIRRLAKLLPGSDALDRALEADDRQYEGGPASVVTGPPGATRSQRLAAELRARRGIEGPEPEREFGVEEGVERPLRSEDEGGDEDGFGEDLEETEAGARG